MRLKKAENALEISQEALTANYGNSINEWKRRFIKVNPTTAVEEAKWIHTQAKELQSTIENKAFIFTRVFGTFGALTGLVGLILFPDSSNDISRDHPILFVICGVLLIFGIIFFFRAVLLAHKAISINVVTPATPETLKAAINLQTLNIGKSTDHFKISLAAELMAITPLVHNSGSRKANYIWISQQLFRNAFISFFCAISIVFFIKMTVYIPVPQQTGDRITGLKDSSKVKGNFVFSKNNKSNSNLTEQELIEVHNNTDKLSIKTLPKDSLMIKQRYWYSPEYQTDSLPDSTKK